MSYQTAISGLDWQMVPSGMTVPPGGVAAMGVYEQGMGAICAGNNVGAITCTIAGGNYSGTINDIVYDVIVVSGAINTNRTVTLYYNNGTQNGVKRYTVLCYANASSGGPYNVTLTTGSGATVLIPISASGDTAYGTPTMLLIYVDSNGNVCSSGDIVDSGSNSNGSYVKFADGTMICKGIHSSDQAIGANAIIAAQYQTFAAAFASVPVISQCGVTSSNSQPCYGYQFGVTTSYGYFGVVGGPAAVAYGLANFMAIERWK